MPQMIGSVKAQPQCPHPPYSAFKTGSNGGVGAICEDGQPAFIISCVPPTIGGQTAEQFPVAGGAACVAFLAGGASDTTFSAFLNECAAAGGTPRGDNTRTGTTCVYHATVTETCPTPSGAPATKTPSVNQQSGMCYIKPGAT